MGLSAGIVGLPNVGKSTLFNAITNSSVEAANYPFATIEPNHGVVPVNDKRLKAIADLIKPNKLTPAIFEFVDIAGLVKGASKGEGLGNQFLSNILETDLICHMIRCFENSDITHVENTVDPIRDLKTINLELILHDLEKIEKVVTRVASKAKAGDAEANEKLSFMNKIKVLLESEKLAKEISVESEKQKLWLKEINLITSKPFIYVANISESDIVKPENSHHYLNLKKYLDSSNEILIPISAQIEAEIAQLPFEERATFMDEVGITQSGLDKVIFTAYTRLGLNTFFTFGKVEVKAWTFKQGMSAPECAGLIHTDLEKHFIRAEICGWDDLVANRDMNEVKAKGKLRIEGKSYIVKDGDVIYFRTSA